MAGRRAARAAAAAALCAAAALAGCGGDERASGPATLVPAAAPVYVEIAANPGAGDREALAATLGGLLDDDDPAAAIDRALDGLLSGEGFSWSEDIDPWAGERAAIFTLGLEDDSPGAAIVEVADAEAAERELERIVADATTAGDGEEVEDLAQAMVEDHAILGTEAGVQAAIDAAADSDLADSDRFEEATSGLAGDRLATAYVAPEPTLDALVEAGELDAAERDRLAAALGPAAGVPSALGLAARGEEIVVELDAPAELIAGASELFDRAPEGAWLALGLAGAGDLAATLLAAAEPLLGSGLARVEREIDLDVGALADASGDAAAFVGGTSILGLGGAAIVEADDQEGLAAAVDELGAALEDDRSVRVEPLGIDGEGFTLLPADLPIRFPFAIRDGLLVAGLGDAAVEEAFAPGSPLSESEELGVAAERLGDDLAPVSYLDFERMLELLDGLPGFWEDPDLAPARPYIRRLGDLVVGARSEEERTLLRISLAVREDDEERSGDGEA